MLRPSGKCFLIATNPTRERNASCSARCWTPRRPSSKDDGVLGTFSSEDKALIGRQAKRLLDLGRIRYIEKHGGSAQLVVSEP